MNNLIISWKELAKEKHGSINEGVRHLNNVCGTKVTSSCINSMSKGEKNVPASANRYMLFVVVSDKFKKANFRMNDLEVGVFLNDISIPERIK